MLFQRTQDQFPAVIPGDTTFFYLGTLIHVVCTHNIHTRAHTHSHTNYNKDLVDGSLIKRCFLPIPATCVPFQYTHSGVLHVVFWRLHVLWHTHKHPNKCLKKKPSKPKLTRDSGTAVHICNPSFLEGEADQEKLKASSNCLRIKSKKPKPTKQQNKIKQRF